MDFVEKRIDPIIFVFYNQTIINGEHDNMVSANSDVLNYFGYRRIVITHVYLGQMPTRLKNIIQIHIPEVVKNIFMISPCQNSDEVQHHILSIRNISRSPENMLLDFGMLWMMRYVKCITVQKDMYLQLSSLRKLLSLFQMWML